MTTYTAPPAPPAPAPPGPPKRHHWGRIIVIGAAAFVLGAAVIGIAGGEGSPSTPKSSTSQPAASPVTSLPPSAPAAAPAPAPSPDGNYTGSGDYTLSPTVYGNNYLVGEVDLTNTGNIGTVIRVKFTWPQEGYPPIKAVKTVRVPYGASKTVRFHVSAGNVSNSNVIDLLQSWQEGHNFKDGFTYKATIIDTFGAVH